MSNAEETRAKPGNRKPATCKPKPPRFAQRFLEWYCRPELLEDLQGDLNEYFYKNLKSKGPTKAKLIYTIDVIKFCRSYTLRKPKPSRAMNELIVFRNYYKTSIRNIAKNRLFSTINIVGLAISMCIGLLLIALVTELNTYDAFHKNSDRIYRVENIRLGLDKVPKRYASTSVYAGKEIKHNVAGIEDAVIIRADFEKDLQFNDKVIPLDGLWADQSFFNVFSFALVSGNAATALKEPYSLVLTETSALKVFGRTDVLNKQVLIDTVNYTITSVMKDPPLHSHLRFDMLGSFITLDAYKLATHDREWMNWNNMCCNYVYVLLAEKNDALSLEKSFTRISEDRNRTLENVTIDLRLTPLREIIFSKDMSNSIGPTVESSVLELLGWLAIIVIVSACFNYTNLSIARALRRTREVGIRKVIGATRSQLFNQFVFESVIISLLALGLALLLFFTLRPEYIAMNEAFQETVTLELTPALYLYFIGFAILVGILAGALPASFFSRINTAVVLKNVSSVKLFRHVSLRKALIVFQYTLSLLFIVSVAIAYKQYKYSLSFDMGFLTENVFIVNLQQNDPGPLIKEFSEMPEISMISQSMYISSIGASYSGNVRFKDPMDSATLYFNHVDDHYILLHDHKILTGRNFNPLLAENAEKKEIIVNQHTVQWMKLKNPDQAIGEELIVDGKKMIIIGVAENFNHNMLREPIQNFAFMNDPKRFQIINIKIQTADVLTTVDKIKAIWKKVDNVHPFEGKFYEEHIRESYNKLSWMIKTLGSVAVLAISIASMGLLGMVVFTTETRLKEISIRKVMGASERNLIFLMSRGFIWLLILSSCIAIPLAWYFFDQIAFARFAFRAPIGLVDMFSGVLVVIALAVVMIGSQTMKAARLNPAEVLKNE